MPTEHAEYSPSGLKAEMLCLGRHLATKDMDNGSSPAADRGTECHDWAEKILLTVINYDEYDIPEFVEDWQEECTLDMVQHAADKYVEMSLLGEVTVWTEKQVNLGFLTGHHKGAQKIFDASEIWGTCDVIMHCPDSGTLCILDYKTGRGVDVHPKENVQLMIYALGAFADYKDEGIKSIELCISQPRIDRDLRVWKTAPEYLMEWAYDELIPACAAMSKEGAEFTPGKEQCQWCPLSGGKCPAQKAKMIDMFDEPRELELPDGALDLQQLSKLMSMVPEIEQFINHVKKTAFEVMEDGQTLPGYKLVAGRSSRCWVDVKAAETYIRGQLGAEASYTKKFITAPQAEKLMKEKMTKTAVKKNFYKHVHKPEGKRAMALEGDPRPAIIINKTAGMLDLDDLI